MKSSAIVLFCLTYALSNVFAASWEASQGLEQVKNLSETFVELEFGKEYSEDEIKKLSTNAARAREVSSTSVIEGSSLDVSLQAQASIYLQQAAQLTFVSFCDKGADYLEAKVLVTYDGHYVRYTGKQNIDSFGKNKSGGGYGKPISDDKQFFHRGCRYTGVNRMCGYNYYGVIDTTIRVLVKYPGIDVGIHHEKDPLPWRRPTVTETCQTFLPGEKMYCPEPSERFPAQFCTISAVVAVPIKL